ncbi:MAG: AmmeMemoRadiSam system protein B, partial [Candidatus Omnitrophica bacterium]|nr:AmmeMemoRadiSam system protein B [Candidatus Omnitrophota bacterium]
MKLFFPFFILILNFIPLSLFSEEIKKPIASGTFYPASREELVKMVDKFIEEADVKSEKKDIIGAVVPHAGYIYSGRIAGYTYRAIKDKTFRVVVLIGPSHFEFFDGISVYNIGAFQTPLGNVEIDTEFANKLIKENPKVSFYPRAFRQEHSLEVQFPFLQRALKDFKIVPILIGNSSFENCKILAESLVSVIGNRKDVLIIASTDLSHYHNYEDAVRIDTLTLSEISKLDPKNFFEDLSTENVELCGGGAVLTLMIASRTLGAGDLKILKYANSGDVTGDRLKVVGYASGIITRGIQKGDEQEMLNESQKSRLLYIARYSIENYLKTDSKPQLLETDPKLVENKGAFVTITKHNQLRGCIGSIYPTLPLYRTISDMAIEAATNDPRFPPLILEELDEIDLEISVLSPLEKIDDISKIKVGTHGLLIRKGFYSGLLLPQVAAEYSSTREEFLEHTCYKAGLNKDAWKKG